MEQNISYYTNLLNIFIKHYNQCNNTNINMFHNIDTIDDTNDMMEEFYEHLTDYKQCDEEYKQIFSPQEAPIDNFEQLFGLKINGKMFCVCALMIPILEYIAKDIDWVKTNWNIIPIKME